VNKTRTDDVTTNQNQSALALRSGGLNKAFFATASRSDALDPPSAREEYYCPGRAKRAAKDHDAEHGRWA